MVETPKGVNTVVPEPPAEPVTPEKPETPVVPETPPAESVIPVVPETPETPEVPETPEDKNPMIPRARLNEEIQKRHELEARLKALEEAPKPPVVPVVPQKDEIEVLAEQMSAEAGEDEFGNRLLPVKAAVVQLRTQARIQFAATANGRLENNVSEFVKKNPRAAKYADRVKAELLKLEPGVKDNPINVGRKYLEILGADVENIEKEAFENGKKKALEQKKIVSQAAGETPGALPEGKLAGDMLNADEKAFADRHNMSYDDYYKAKGNKRV